MAYFNWISTASFIALTKEGSKTYFNCIVGNKKLIQHRFIKSYVFQIGRVSHSEKIMVISIEHLKQKLSLEKQSNLDYSKYQGTQESFRLIGSSNDRKRESSDIFGKARMLS